MQDDLNILLVGCGGIGVELLNNFQYYKNIKKLHLVDMDVVETSNLSRQYIFGREDVGKGKATAAARWFKENFKNGDTNSVEIVAHECAIQDEQFDSVYYSQFNYVFNALDNLQARQHVYKYVYTLQVLSQKTYREVYGEDLQTDQVLLPLVDHNNQRIQFEDDFQSVSDNPEL